MKKVIILIISMCCVALLSCGSTTSTNDEQTQTPSANVSPSTTLNELINKGITVDVSSTIVGTWNVQGFSIGAENPDIDTTSTITLNADNTVSEEGMLNLVEM